MFPHICEWDLLLRTWFISEAWNFPRLPFVCQNSVTDYWVAHLEYFCVVACFLSCFREGPGSWRNNIPTNSVRLSWRLDVGFLNFYWFSFIFLRKRDIFHSLMHSPDACSSWGWSRPEQEPRIPLVSPMWEQRLRSAVLQAMHQQEAGWAVEGLRLQPGTLIQDVGIPGGDLTSVPDTCPWDFFRRPTLTSVFSSLLCWSGNNS